MRLEMLMIKGGYSLRHTEPIDWNFKCIKQLLHTWMIRHLQRQELLKLNDCLLNDIGVNRAEAEQEADKWFWQE
ncbi:MAG: DUF1127 domain-containing protein [SAR324 cluster bacterium]|nr:DUF1127 domain-containing protein [SAR324 cluster bacterium]